MRLDYDCVRNILLVVESLNYGEELHNDNFSKFPALREYHPGKMEYTVKRLAEAGYIPSEPVMTMVNGNIRYSISSMTWDGHQFLDYIRNNDVWNKTKSHLPSPVDSFPVKIIVAIAAKIIQNSID